MKDVKKIKQVIKRVIIKNFRLFDENPRDFEFGGGFTQVIANNGKGKTSLWLAIKIGLTGDIPREMRIRSENGVIHYPQIDENFDSEELQKNLNAEIKIILNNQKENGVRPFHIIDNEMDEINIRTIINPSGAVKYYVNGLKWEKKTLREVLSNCSINPDNPFLFLEQNKTISLLERGPIGLLEALEDILDIKEIRDNLDNAQKS